MRGLLVVGLVACGGTPPSESPPNPEPVAPAPTIPVDAAPPVVEPRPAEAALDPETLPAWEAANTPGTGPAVYVYAVDLPGDRLLIELATSPFVARSVDKRLTGRVA